MELKDLEEKFRKAMVQNAQLDNEKAAVTYMVELYKDKYTDIEEELMHIKVFLIILKLLRIFFFNIVLFNLFLART